MSSYLSSEKVSLTCEVVAKGNWKPRVFTQGSPPGITQPRTVLVTLCYQWDVKAYLQSGLSELLLYPKSCSVQCLHWGSLIFTCFISVYAKAQILKGHHRSQNFTELLTDSLSLERPISGWFSNVALFKLLHMTYTLLPPFESKSLETQHNFCHTCVSSDFKMMNPACKLKCVDMLNIICVWMIPASLPVLWDGFCTGFTRARRDEANRTGGLCLL